MQIRRAVPLKDFQIPSSKHILIDCDVGGDDAMCILLAKYLAQQYGKIIIGITCVQGNTRLKNVVSNSIIACKVAGLSIPIAKGCWKNILGQQISFSGDGYFSEDGIGGNQQLYEELITKQDRKNIFKKKANQSIIFASKLYPKDLSILALGPLTNLATAYLLDNSLPERINSVSIMGGSFSAVGRYEHFTSDFNFFLDPESAHIVLKKFKGLILTTLQFANDFTVKRKEQMFKNQLTKKSRFVKRLYEPIMKRQKQAVLCDPLAAFPALCPQDAKVMVYPVSGQVILRGVVTRGMLSIDWLKNQKFSSEQNLICIVASMDKQHIEQMIIRSILN